MAKEKQKKLSMNLLICLRLAKTKVAYIKVHWGSAIKSLILSEQLVWVNGYVLNLLSFANDITCN